MRLFLIPLLLLSMAAEAAAAAPAAPPRSWDERQIVLPLAGRTMVYLPRTPTAHIVFLVSGAIARTLISQMVGQLDAS